MGRGETRANDDDGVRKEKAKGKEKKWERVRRCQKILFPAITDENNIYKRYIQVCNAWERDQIIKNVKNYLHKSFPAKQI